MYNKNPKMSASSNLKIDLQNPFSKQASVLSLNVLSKDGINN